MSASGTTTNIYNLPRLHSRNSSVQLFTLYSLYGWFVCCQPNNSQSFRWIFTNFDKQADHDLRVFQSSTEELIKFWKWLFPGHIRDSLDVV